MAGKVGLVCQYTASLLITLPSSSQRAPPSKGSQSNSNKNNNTSKTRSSAHPIIKFKSTSTPKTRTKTQKEAQKSRDGITRDGMNQDDHDDFRKELLGLGKAQEVRLLNRSVLRRGSRKSERRTDLVCWFA